MLWQKKETCFMVLSVLLLISSAFRLEIVPKGKSVQYGRLIIGSSSTANEAKDGVVKKLYNEYAGDTNGYQADQPREWSQLVKLRLQSLSPSVQCDNESMTLHIKGSQVPNFLIETSEEGLLPLSQMPSHCGFSVKRARRDISLVAKYDCCKIAQQGDAYILPLHILGVAVELVCPVAPLATVLCSPSAMVVNLGMSPDAVRLKVNGSWQPVNQASTTCGFTLNVGGGLALTAPYTSNCWQFEGAEMLLSMQYVAGELTLSCPAVPLPSATPLPANMQPGTLSDAPTTTSTTTTSTTTLTTVAPASADQQALPHWLPAVHYPYAYAVPWYFPYSQPGTPQTTSTTTIPTTTTTVAPASADQQALPPWLLGMYNPSGYGMPWYFPYSQPGAPQVTQTTPTTTTTTTVAPASADQQALPPWLLGMYNPSGYGIPWYFPYSQSVSPSVAPSSSLLPGMFNPNIPMASLGVPVSGSNSGVKSQMYHLPWMTFPKYPMLNQKPGSPLVNPSKVGSYSAYLSPLQVKGLGK